MVYKQKLSKIGNSVGVSLPKKIRDDFKIKQGQAVYVRDDILNDRIIISKKPLDEDEAPTDKEFYKIVERTGKQYREALKNLADK